MKVHNIVNSVVIIVDIVRGIVINSINYQEVIMMKRIFLYLSLTLMLGGCTVMKCQYHETHIIDQMSNTQLNGYERRCVWVP